MSEFAPEHDLPYCTVYLKLIAVAKSRTKHVIENVKFVSRYSSQAAVETRLSRACFILLNGTAALVL